MDLTLRQAVILRVLDKTEVELHEVIENSIGNDEKALPGLGVLFEIIWQNCQETLQNELAEILKKNLPQA